MKRSSEAGPRCLCGAIAAIVGPGEAHCTAPLKQLDGFGRPCGRRFPFTTEQRTFYVTEDDLQLVNQQPLPEGDSVA